MADPTTRTGAREECGVVAVYAPGEDVARLCYYALYALQHRGQEAAGIAVSDGSQLLVSKEIGLVAQVFDEGKLAGLQGYLGVGHVRYSTAGASTWDNAQPTFKVTPRGTGLALGHNGNLTNTAELAERVAPGTALERAGCQTDSELLTEALAQHEAPLDEALADVCATITGAYSLALMNEDAVHAVRDPYGIRPLVIGRLPNGGYVVASETAALDILGAHVVREVEPGEIVTVDADGIRTRRFAAPDRRFCSFEYVYLARPDHRESGTTVYAARQRMGSLLADESPADADLVIPVPDSGVAAATGYAQRSGLPYAEGLVKNRYVGRTFIEPSQMLRQLGIRLKLNPLRDVLEGQRLVVVDDSIVRGNTSRQLVRMLRESGAAEVHLRITSPPVRNPCFYGIDMATPAELIASGLSIEEIRDFIGADSLAYLSVDALVEATGRDKSDLCMACFTGDYPIAVPSEASGQQLPIFGDPA